MKTCLGEHDDAVERALRATRLSPLDPRILFGIFSSGSLIFLLSAMQTPPSGWQKHCKINRIMPPHCVPWQQAKLSPAGWTRRQKR